MRYLAFTLLLLLLAACTDQQPVAPDMSPVFAVGAGMNKTPISGTIEWEADLGVGRFLTTPSGRCSLFAVPSVSEFTGGVAGLVTFRRRVLNIPCGADPEGKGAFTSSGPFDGDVTFEGSTGMIAGQWTTNCKRDPVSVWSCDGTMNARGSGDLKGVQFHFKWGPGWWPFPYTGTAFSR